MTESDFKEYFNRYYQLLCNYINSYVNDLSLAEDIVQDVFYKIWRDDDSSKPLPYLMKSAKNKMLEYIRKNDRNKSRELNYSQYSDDEAEAIRLEKIDKMNTLVRQLPPKTKEIFILNKYNGITYVQIAKQLNISVKTVENQMSRAFKFIRKNW